MTKFPKLMPFFCFLIALLLSVMLPGAMARADSDWVYVGPDDHTFAKQAPLATILIDYERMKNPGDKLTVRFPNPQTGFEKQMISGFPNYLPGTDSNIFVVYDLSKSYAKKLNNPNSNPNTLLGRGLNANDIAFSFIIEDAAILPDGRRVDVEVAYSNINIRLRTDANLQNLNQKAFTIASGILFRTGHNGQKGDKQFYGIIADANIQVREKDGTVIEYVQQADKQVPARFLFTVTDIDVFRSSTGGYSTIGYASANNYYSEQVIVYPDRLVAGPDNKKIYIPGGKHYDYYNNVADGGVLFYPKDSENDPDPGTYKSGFVAVVDNRKGLHLKIKSSGGSSDQQTVRTYLFSRPSELELAELVQHRIRSVTGPGGNIQTTEYGNPRGDANRNNLEDGDAVLEPGEYNVPVGKTITYTMRPQGYNNSATRIKSIVIRGGVDGSDTEEVNRTFSQDELLGMTPGSTEIVNFKYENKQGILEYRGHGVYNFQFVENSWDHYIEVQWERYLTVQKEWAGDEGHELERPATLTFHLIRDNHVTEQSVTMERDDTGKYPPVVFTDLDHTSSYEVVEEKLENYTRSYRSGEENGVMIVTNTYNPGKRNIEVRKIWNDNDNQDGLRPESVHITLLQNGAPVSNSTVLLDPANHWEQSWKNLPARDEQDQPYTYSVQEDPVPGGYSFTWKETDYGNIEVTNSHVPETFDIEVRKFWEGGGTPPGIVYYRLHNGFIAEDKVVSVTAADNWIYLWRNLPKYRNGELLRYTVTEDVPPESDYIPDWIDQNGNPRLIVNRYDPNHVRVMVLIEWHDEGNRDSVRPDQVEVELIQDGEPTGRKITVKADDHWYGRFDGLDKWSSNGELIEYSVRGAAVDQYHQWPLYHSDITQDRNIFCIPYEHTSATRNIWVRKIWNDAEHDDARPASVTIRLYANGRVVRHKTIDQDVGWRDIEFADLPAFEGGVPITYTITEDRTAGYSNHTHSINDFTYEVTNTYNPGKVSVDVVKAWYGHNNQDGLRPESVTIHLLADGAETGETLTLSDAYKWHGTFEALDQQKEGQDIQYTVTEDEVPDYETTIDGTMETGFIVSNYHEPATVTYNIEKTWMDKGFESARPEYLTLRLYADGHPLMSRMMLAEEDWKGVVFRHLPVYSHGKKIYYVVTEDSVNGYKSEMKLSEGKVINTYIEKNEKNSGENASGKTHQEIPKTGDQSQPAVWVIVTALGLIGIGLAIWRFRKPRK
ncbi:MAG: Cna B-type domain-containing protein [Clostridia bacterium]|nr:Cna B-type domain-containing protein [Clostridia bacterium]